MTTEDRSILVLYGSETGNAKDAAERIGRTARRHHFLARVVGMDNFPLPTLIDEPLVIFVCSTTGNGVEPANMTPLWRALLRAELPSDLFEEMDFAVLGLGDSSYQRFNWAAKRLQRRLLSLGGQQICDRGDADDQDTRGPDGVIDPWIQTLFERIRARYPSPPGVDILPETGLYPATLQIIPCPTLPSSNGNFQHPPEALHHLTLTQNTRITRDDWYQDVRHIVLKADGDVKYEPGDVAVLYPENSPADVDTLLRRLGWDKDADNPIYVVPSSSDRTPPLGYPNSTTPTTLRTLLTKAAAITAVPRKSFIELLSYFTMDPLETEKLREFCTPEGQDDLFDYTTRVRRTTLEVLLEFRSAVVPQEYIADLFPELRPRQFSIASSLFAHPSEIHLCVAIVSYRTKLRIPRGGICTSWLAGLQSGTKLRIGLKEGTMRLLEGSNRPMVMVGPGTGVAPMRAMLEERIARGESNNVLYFGCRSANADYHFRSEWETYQERGHLTHRLAASRDQDAKVYVQHLISLDSKKIKEWLVDRNGGLYISGSSNQMPTAVRKAVVTALKNECEWSEEASIEYVNAMEAEGRWCEECW
ncbi:NAPDH-dependent diflavin reductase [Ceratobasidium sp. 394]|nr:NAPDH-dependent diflavin reductase [Ceratobasidium sp. 394]KAG9077318.1 NAPDH-dependent diflavin reductase [Ceratobasidium sp. UAMH 11750]